MNFVNEWGENWNMPWFHARNHWAAEGLVLAGFDIPDDGRPEFDQHLEELGYQFSEQTVNPAYQFFVSDLQS